MHLFHVEKERIKFLEEQTELLNKYEQKKVKDLLEDDL